MEIEIIGTQSDAKRVMLDTLRLRHKNREGLVKAAVSGCADAFHWYEESLRTTREVLRNLLDLRRN